MKKLTFTLLFTLITLGGAFAQKSGGEPPKSSMFHGSGPERRMMRSGPPPFDWWRNSEVAQRLNLTDPQKQQLEQLFTQQRLQLVDLKAAVEKEEIKLQALMNADNIQENAVMAQIDATQTARGRLEKSFATMALSFRKVLTAEQWKQLQDRDTLMFHRRGPDGRDGHEGPGPGPGADRGPGDRGPDGGPPKE